MFSGTVVNERDFLLDEDWEQLVVAQNVPHGPSGDARGLSWFYDLVQPFMNDKSFDEK